MNAETVQAGLDVLEGDCVSNCRMGWSYFQHDWEQMWRDKALILGLSVRDRGRGLDEVVGSRVERGLARTKKRE